MTIWIYGSTLCRKIKNNIWLASLVDISYYSSCVQNSFGPDEYIRLVLFFGFQLASQLIKTTHLATLSLLVVLYDIHFHPLRRHSARWYVCIDYIPSSDGMNGLDWQHTPATVCLGGRSALRCLIFLTNPILKNREVGQSLSMMLPNLSHLALG